MAIWRPTQFKVYKVPNVVTEQSNLSLPFISTKNEKVTEIVYRQKDGVWVCSQLAILALSKLGNSLEGKNNLTVHYITLTDVKGFFTTALLLTAFFSDVTKARIPTHICIAPQRHLKVFNASMRLRLFMPRWIYVFYLPMVSNHQSL